MLPAASTARTWKVWEPSDRPEYSFGVVQAAQAPVSSRHWNVTPVSGELNWNCALVLLLDEPGPLLMTVSGTVWSIVHVYAAGVGSTVWDASTARTRKVCEPWASPVYDRGLVQVAHEELSGTSSWHWKVRLAAGVTSSVPLKVKVAAVVVVAASGLPVMDVSGASEPPVGGEPPPSVSTSCGRLSLFSRLWNCCSASWFSFASRTRKPLFAPEYIPCTWPATFHSR